MRSRAPPCVREPASPSLFPKIPGEPEGRGRGPLYHHQHRVWSANTKGDQRPMTG